MGPRSPERGRPAPSRARAWSGTAQAGQDGWVTGVGWSRGSEPSGAEVPERGRSLVSGAHMTLTTRPKAVIVAPMSMAMWMPRPLIAGGTRKVPRETEQQKRSDHGDEGKDGGAAIGRVLSASFLGSPCRVRIQLPDQDLMLAQIPKAEAARLSPGSPVRVTIRPVPVFAEPA
ncbi:putative spermidine/putrescine transport system ATP-binding protein [Streptomyces hygroscopicus]|nr:putative spermidine/putrescine transport system ATP-binding protein [Streptomyces hygroscopicus]